MLWYGAIGIVFAAFAAAYVMPILGSLFAGRERIGLRRRPAPSAASPVVCPRFSRPEAPASSQPASSEAAVRMPPVACAASLLSNILTLETYEQTGRR